MKNVFPKDLFLMMQSDPPEFWNVIDGNAKQCIYTCFQQPHVLNECSLGHMFKSELERRHHADKESNYLLYSQDGAQTLFHQDFSHTSVIYFLMKGCKTFHVIRPSKRNQCLFDLFLNQPRRDLFFGAHPDLDDGGCQQITIRAGEAIAMPAGFIHFVETTGFSVAYGINFIHKYHLSQAAAAYVKERMLGERYNACYPSFPVLALKYIIRLMNTNLRLNRTLVHQIVETWDSLKSIKSIKRLIEIVS